MTKSIYFSLTVPQIQALDKIMNKKLSRYDIGDLAKSQILELIGGKKNLDLDIEFKMLRIEKLKVDIKLKLKILGNENQIKENTVAKHIIDSDGSYYDDTNFKVDKIKGQYYFECKQKNCTVIISGWNDEICFDQMKLHLQKGHGVGLYKGTISQ